MKTSRSIEARALELVYSLFLEQEMRSMKRCRANGFKFKLCFGRNANAKIHRGDEGSDNTREKRPLYTFIQSIRADPR